MSGNNRQLQFAIRLLLAGLGLLAALQLPGCASFGGARVPPPPAPGSEGPPRVPARIAAIPDATWHDAAISSRGNPRSYEVDGETYYVAQTRKPYDQKGWASWYGKDFHGEKTSSGERYNMYAMTAAHKTLPIPSWVRVTNLENGASVVLKINDRGPFHAGRIIDVSYVAAVKLGMIRRGTAFVEVKALLGPEQDQNRLLLVSNEPASTPAPDTATPEAQDGGQPQQQHLVAGTVEASEMREINAATGTDLTAPAATTGPTAVNTATPASVPDSAAATTQQGLDQTVLQQPADTTATNTATMNTALIQRYATPQYLSAGAFASGANASKLSHKLQSYGFLGKVSTAQLDSGLQQVRLGPYATEDQLLTDELALKSMGIDPVQFQP